MAGVKGDASPYDGNLTYWVGRNSKPRAKAKGRKGTQLHPNCPIAPSPPHPSRTLRLCVTPPTAEAIERQKGKCPHCNRLFMERDGAVELHHIDGNHHNSKKKNLVALHRDCHQAQAVHRKRINNGLVKRASHWHRST